MGVFDTLRVRANNFKFSREFREKYPDFPLTEEGGNLYFDDQCKDFKGFSYRGDKAIIKNLEINGLDWLPYDMHGLEFIKDGRELKLYILQNDWNNTPWIWAHCIDNIFLLQYIENIPEYKIINKGEEIFYISLTDSTPKKYYSWDFLINVKKGIVTEVRLLETMNDWESVIEYLKF